MKKGTKTLIAIGVASAVGGVTLAVAGDAAFRHAGLGGHGMHFLGKGQFPSLATEMIRTVDTDGDDRVSQAEIDEVLEIRVAAYDANGDGDLGLEEFAGLWNETTRPLTVRVFQSLDADGDAVITKEEFEILFANVVERLDHDGDGNLSMRDWRYGHDDERGRHSH